ncbi:MAG: hypothetical protein RLY87_477 [Chloroflexota bacterium]
MYTPLHCCRIIKHRTGAANPHGLLVILRKYQRDTVFITKNAARIPDPCQLLYNPYMNTTTAIATTVTRRVALHPDAVFAHLLGCDPTRMFHPVGGLPGVAAVRLNGGSWRHQGDARTITLTDGSTAREELTAVAPPHSFTYTVSAYTSILRLLVVRGESTFRCIPAKNGGTEIVWTYAYTPQSVWVQPLVWLIRVLLWERYMTAAMNRMMSDIS